MKKTSGILLTLTALQTLGVATFKQIADHWNRSPKLARTYVARYCELGYVERVNPGTNPAQFQLTAKGLEILEPDDEANHKPGRASHEALEGDRLVARAIRTQPASVWDLGRAT